MLSEVPVLETPCSRTVFGSGGAAATGLKNKTFRESLCQSLVCNFAGFAYTNNNIANKQITGQKSVAQL